MFKLVNFGRGIVGVCSFDSTPDAAREYMRSVFGSSILLECVDDMVHGNVYYVIDDRDLSGDMELSMRSDDLYDTLLDYAKRKNVLELLK